VGGHVGLPEDRHQPALILLDEELFKKLNVLTVAADAGGVGGGARSNAEQQGSHGCIQARHWRVSSLHPRR